MSKQEIKCPVCNNNIKTEYYVECYGVVEETRNCSCCGYFYNFAYGNYMEIVNRREFVWTYKCCENTSCFNKFNKLINKHMIIHKKKQKKFKTNYYQKEPYYTYFCGWNGNDDKIKKIRGGV